MIDTLWPVEPEELQHLRSCRCALWRRPCRCTFCRRRCACQQTAAAPLPAAAGRSQLWRPAWRQRSGRRHLHHEHCTKMLPLLIAHREQDSAHFSLLKKKPSAWRCQLFPLLSAYTGLRCACKRAVEEALARTSLAAACYRRPNTGSGTAQQKFCTSLHAQGAFQTHQQGWFS